MNIITRTFNGHTIVRPDTTWEKDSEDLFVPEFVEGLSYSPVLFARISKPGRSIVERFASRYYDAVNFGVFLHPEFVSGSEEAPSGTGDAEEYAQGSCLDHTSFLPTPLFLPLTLGEKDNDFELYKDEDILFSCHGGCDAVSTEAIEEAIAKASRMVYFRTGDFLAIELAPARRLLSRGEGSGTIKACWCSNPTLSFKIIF